MDTVTRFDRSRLACSVDRRQARGSWVKEIADLRPLKVYWHDSSLAIVLRESGNERD